MVFLLPNIMICNLEYKSKPSIAKSLHSCFNPRGDHWAEFGPRDQCRLCAWPKFGPISTTNLAACVCVCVCVCVCAKFDQFLPARFYFVSKRPEIFFA